MTMTGTTTVIMVVMVDGAIMTDGVIEGVDGGRVPILTFTLDRLTRPTDTMRILLHTGITDTVHTGTTADTRIEDCPRTPRTKHLYRPGRLQEKLKRPARLPDLTHP